MMYVWGMRGGEHNIIICLRAVQHGAYYTQFVNTMSSTNSIYIIVCMCMYGEGSELFWFHFFGASCLCLEIASIHYPGKLGAGL